MVTPVPRSILAGGFDLVNFGGGSATSYTTTLPVITGTIYVRVWSLIGSSYFFANKDSALRLASFSARLTQMPSLDKRQQLRPMTET